MPMLLKKSARVAGAYELRGPVYIPGLMMVEGLNGKDSPENDFSTILIC